MPIKKYRPISNSCRISSVQTFKDITKTKPEKSLVVFRKQKSGRSCGKITVRHRGGGARRCTRIVDSLRERFDIPAKIVAVEYDPNRGARLLLIQYIDGEKRYILAPQGVEVGDMVVSTRGKGEIKNGNRMPLENIPVGVNVHDVEMQPGKGGQLVRGAGTTAQLMAIEGDYATLKLPSGEVRMILKVCEATVGSVSNPDYGLVRWGKAGRTRHRGIRPTVRGKAMNPVDHPHGGGEGRSPIGLKHPKTPQGKPALGVKTRRKKTSDKLIIKRRPKGLFVGTSS
ncbi:MAG: 50S ribosomal protein L2 [Candidatus Uhrbacteria bacterium GW2011_GWE2_45_35]|uniref:Large ribosomal subunit protein uL2 n=2 Tax=Candidatus Uhriibacteriota TaxID=1752732 RepID=A0A0G1MJ25_9BACT|nr:MAG: 50S ribosomal protein L2 [Candidatus Uhrbacteria bacterium GW2011_GWF2_44_350]KKU09230.1 MAG: 50S ribosomal protein L2 [Candidatus Uhrbacteria bacterium GW2011_GWE2_45_35]HBR80487.1 50S ribosomal protein L2 [Candidatus Uhrbacteria bacterium]HCU31528.1 50S ribosomal protein L2 [Candidatus Uhrbacteria bacterium]